MMAAPLVLLNGRLCSPDGAGAGCDAIVIDGGRIAAVTGSAPLGWSQRRQRSHRCPWAPENSPSGE
jgi:predicted amidohydrolase YtcJ